jgi:hypothetical protein
MAQARTLGLAVLAMVFLAAGCGDGGGSSGKSAETGKSSSAQSQPAPQARPATPQAEPVDNSPPQDASAPHVVKSIPADNAANVDPTTDQIVFEFSADMFQSSSSTQEVEGFAYPENTAQGFFATPKRYVMKVKLEADKKYAIGINRKGDKSFVTSADRLAVQPYVLTFTTGKDYSRIYGWNDLESRRIKDNEAYLNQIVREGDVITMVQKASLVRNTTTTTSGGLGGGVPPQVMNEETTADETFSDKIIEIKDRRFQKVRRKYGDVVISLVIGPPRHEQTTPQPQANKEFLMERGGGDWRVSAKGIALPADDAKTVSGELLLPDFLPTDKIVAVNDVWKAEGEWIGLLARVITGPYELDDAQFKMRLGGIYTEGGSRIARIDIKGWVSTKVPLAQDRTDALRYEVKGKVLFDLTKRRVLSMHVEGAGRCESDLDMGDGMPSMHRAIDAECSVDISWDYE